MGELLRLTRDFFARDVLEVAPDLPGKLIAHRTQNGILRLRISEAEAYRGEQDTACHAHRGRTRRTEVLYGPPGTLYVCATASTGCSTLSPDARDSRRPRWCAPV